MGIRIVVLLILVNLNRVSIVMDWRILLWLVRFLINLNSVRWRLMVVSWVALVLVNFNGDVLGVGGDGVIGRL